LALTSPTSGGRSVGIVRLQTQAMEFSFIIGEVKFKSFSQAGHISWFRETKEQAYKILVVKCLGKETFED
jgi:hypothetical protein